MFDTIEVEGYRLSELSFGFVGPLLGTVGKEDPERINGIELREHGLSGGEIQVFLSPANQTPANPGYWYAVKCDHDETADTDVVGTIHIRRMDATGQKVAEMSCPLEELDRSHLLDRIQGEVLAWHAQACGLGPFAKSSTKSRPRR